MLLCGKRLPAGVFLGSFLSPAESAVDDCVKRCAADSECRAFSLDGRDLPNGCVCTLFRSQEGMTDATTWVSGVRLPDNDAGRMAEILRRYGGRAGNTRAWQQDRHWTGPQTLRTRPRLRPQPTATTAAKAIRHARIVKQRRPPKDRLRRANFPGSVLVFSWPSAANVFYYDQDQTNAQAAAPHLAEIFRLLSSEIGKKNVYIVAHSMGNQVLVNALVQSAMSKADITASELVMAASDVALNVFQSEFDQIRAVATNVTLVGRQGAPGVDREVARGPSRLCRLDGSEYLPGN